MPKKKQLTLDPNTNKLSRLASKHLPLVAIKGLDGGDNIAPFGTLTSDIICYHLYDILPFPQFSQPIVVLND